MKLEVHKLSACYGRARILFDVSLKVGDGEVVALLGRNGAGKTTTLRAIMGLVSGRQGRVIFDGRDISALATHRIAAHGLGYVPEDRRIFADLSVEENLIVGEQVDRPRALKWSRERIFALFPNLATMRDRPAGRISGGEQQMLAIARSLTGGPSAIMLDEPSEGLAPKVVADLREAILDMKHQGLGVLLSEQNLRFCRAIADRAYIIEKGRIRFHGTMAEAADGAGSASDLLSV